MPLEKQLYYKNNGGALSIFIVNAADKIFAYETNLVYTYLFHLKKFASGYLHVCKHLGPFIFCIP